MTSNNPAPQLTIRRLFDAPRELVFKAWTDSKFFAQWWGPKDFTNPVCELDLRPGGRLYIELTDPEGVVYPVKGTFHEVIPPERLVFTTASFEDEVGELQLEALNTVIFEDDQGKTRLTVHVSVSKVNSQVDWALDGMSEGYNESLDRLAELLAQP
jgi:uncharacterized protein YndB with AHSA1/START domain